MDGLFDPVISSIQDALNQGYLAQVIFWVLVWNFINTIFALVVGLNADEAKRIARERRRR